MSGILTESLFGIPLTGDAEAVERLKKSIVEKSLQQQNISSPDYLHGVSSISVYDPWQQYIQTGKVETAPGFVAHKNPDVVNLASSSSADMANVLAHEAAHSQEIAARRRADQDAKNHTLYEILARKDGATKAADYRKQIQNNFSTYADTTSDFLGGYGRSKNVPWDERLADLQALEAQLPKGKRLLDTPLGRAVFNTPELQQFWMSANLPLAVKAMPQSEQYQNGILDRINQFSETFKDESRNTGYIQAAMKALKEAATKTFDAPKYR